jgi:sugar (pentulose or hexulose) kinase
MKKEVILIFDIGKTNKKALLFDMDFKVLHDEETKFEEVFDDDGFGCDDGEKLEKWIDERLDTFLHHKQYLVGAVNFSTYGATLVYVDETGKRIAPVYNYLKPMPDEVMKGFYDRYGGIDEFSRQTASPPLGMLNSGLQILWLKKKKAEIFEKAGAIMHLPQYLSFRLTGKVTSEHTSIGCHTAMWDFDNMQYHRWLSEESVGLPAPADVGSTVPVELEGQTVKVGIGIHDSSASLAPYILNSPEPFILISTGTWCINMNPFNHEPLTAKQLRRDCLCYMSVSMKPVKSSRFFLGHIHDVNVKMLEDHFRVVAGHYKSVKADARLVKELISRSKGISCFFPDGLPKDYVAEAADLKKFASFKEAYHQLMIDLTGLVIESIKLIVPEEDRTMRLYITGGFSKNEIFTGLIASAFEGKSVYTSEIDNATSLGAAMVISKGIGGKSDLSSDLGLKPVIPF